ncbi:hypothetical protein [Streptomyces orinoci]|uniref:Uncharacterized protein n=1 Tax=Streptomyces orinoci TaxID=67339 RepID=A0ABV3JYD1_STRON|nr:hypothetical protein [Streptomyces orinoci]
MGEALDIMQVATGGAGVLVAEMVKSGWELVRSTMVRFFQRGGDEVAEQELRLLDAAQARLTSTAESERASIVESLQQQLTIQLAAFLQKHPDGAADLQALIDQAEQSGDGRASINAHHNTNSQVVISGGSISGGSFTYQPPRSEK